MNKEELIKICKQVSVDVENDAKEFDGKPFTGKVVAEYFGYHGAAINALAKVLKEVVKSQTENTIQSDTINIEVNEIDKIADNILKCIEGNKKSDIKQSIKNGFNYLLSLNKSAGTWIKASELKTLNYPTCIRFDGGGAPVYDTVCSMEDLEEIKKQIHDFDSAYYLAVKKP